MKRKWSAEWWAIALCCVLLFACVMVVFGENLESWLFKNRSWVNSADCSLVGLRMGDPMYLAKEKIGTAAAPSVEILEGPLAVGEPLYWAKSEVRAAVSPIARYRVFVAGSIGYYDVNVRYSADGTVSGVMVDLSHGEEKATHYVGPSWADLVSALGVPPDNNTAKPDNLTGLLTNVWPGYAAVRNVEQPESVLTLELRPECGGGTGRSV